MNTDLKGIRDLPSYYVNGTTCDYDSSKYGSPQLVLKRLHEFEQSDLLWLRTLVEYADSCKLYYTQMAL